MNNFLKPTTFKIILALVLALIWFLGPILYGRIAVNSGNTPENSNLAMVIVDSINYATGIIFYPPAFIFNLFVPKSFIVNSLLNNTHGYILFLSSIAYILLILIESYLISCIIFYIVSAVVSSRR